MKIAFLNIQLDSPIACLKTRIQNAQNYMRRCLRSLYTSLAHELNEKTFIYPSQTALDHFWQICKNVESRKTWKDKPHLLQNMKNTRHHPKPTLQARNGDIDNFTRLEQR